MTLVRTLDRMQQDGWVERRPDPSDRRAHRLYLREAAKPIVARMWKLFDKARAEVLSVLKVQEREQLLELLQRLHDHLHELTGCERANGVPLGTDGARGEARAASSFKQGIIHGRSS